MSAKGQGSLDLTGHTGKVLSSKPDMLAPASRGQPPVAGHAGQVQRLHHHSSRRLGYRRGGLVVMVVPDVDYPGMELASPGKEPLPAVGRIAAAVDLPAAGNGPVQAPQPLQAGGSTFRFSTMAP